MASLFIGYRIASFGFGKNHFISPFLRCVRLLSTPGLFEKGNVYFGLVTSYSKSLISVSPLYK